MPPSFEKLLVELIKRAASPDDPISREFHDGDAAHLDRWLRSGQADKIWQKISNGPFNSGDAFEFVGAVLEIRRDAAKADALARDVPALAKQAKHLALRTRKHAIEKLTNNEITAAQYLALNQRVEEALGFDQVRDPLLSVRSDENGTRRRTLFCRMLSDVLHYTTGQWHDDAVRALCEIAFDCDDVTLDMVRSARRDSTRKRR